MTAVFSHDRVYRYVLRRDLPVELGREQATAAFVCLNPSTADEVFDDPTVRRCKGYAAAWGYTRLVMLNLFALRATKPAKLYAHPDPVGAANDSWIGAECEAADLVVAAWGAHGAYLGRGAAVEDIVRVVGKELHALAFTNGGQPKHPLYLPGSLEPTRWLGSGA